MGIQNHWAHLSELPTAESSRAVISASQGKRWMKRGPLGLLGLKPQPERHARPWKSLVQKVIGERISGLIALGLMGNTILKDKYLQSIF